jgi:hypothetical protein
MNIWHANCWNKEEAMLATNGHHLNLSGPARKNTTVYDTMLANTTIQGSMHSCNRQWELTYKDKKHSDNLELYLGNWSYRPTPLEHVRPGWGIASLYLICRETQRSGDPQLWLRVIWGCPGQSA